MNLLPCKFGKRARGKGKVGNGRSEGLGSGVLALKRAALRGERSVVRIHGEAVAILPLRSHRRLEWVLEQEEKERELDRLDVEEAERRHSDPSEVPILYEEVRRTLGLDRLSDRDVAIGGEGVDFPAEANPGSH